MHFTVCFVFAIVVHGWAGYCSSSKGSGVDVVNYDQTMFIDVDDCELVKQLSECGQRYKRNTSPTKSSPLNQHLSHYSPAESYRLNMSSKQT
jgi:hypothetical protein